MSLEIEYLRSEIKGLDKSILKYELKNWDYYLKPYYAKQKQKLQNLNLKLTGLLKNEN